MNFYVSERFIITVQTLFGLSLLSLDGNGNLAIKPFSMLQATVYHGIYLFTLLRTFLNGVATENTTSLSKRFKLAADIVKLLYIIQILGFTVMVLLTWWKRKKELDFHRKLFDFDQLLAKRFPCDFFYRQVRNRTILAVVIIITYGLGLYVGTVMLSGSMKTDGFTAMLPFFLHVSQLSILAYSFYHSTYLIKLRFRLLKFIAGKRDRSVDEIKTLFKLFKQLHSFVGHVNDLYGLKALFNILNDFTICTIELFFIFSVLISERDAIRENWRLAVLGFGWVFPHATKIFICCFGSHTAMVEARETLKVLQNLSLINPLKDLQETSDFFILGSMHHAEDFNASEFFTIDMTLIYAIIGAICTYFVVLLQFSDV